MISNRRELNDVGAEYEVLDRPGHQLPALLTARHLLQWIANVYSVLRTSFGVRCESFIT